MNLVVFLFCVYFYGFIYLLKLNIVVYLNFWFLL